MVVGQPGKLVLACAGCEFESHPRRSLKSTCFQGKALKALKIRAFLLRIFTFS